MYKYIIDVALGGSSEQFVRVLSETAREFDHAFGAVGEDYDNAINAPHFTVKYWFSADDEQIAGLTDSIALLVDRTAAFSVSFDGIVHPNFEDRLDPNKNVVHVDPKRGDDGQAFVLELMKLLSSRDWVGWCDFDNPGEGPVPHSTIASVKSADMDAAAARGHAFDGLMERLRATACDRLGPCSSVVESLRVRRKKDEEGASTTTFFERRFQTMID